MEGIITTLTQGVTGVFKIAGQGFDFITGNDLCMLMEQVYRAYSIINNGKYHK